MHTVVRQVVVFGGNGFVGSNTCKALINMGKRVAAVNRSGAPTTSESWVGRVRQNTQSPLLETPSPRSMLMRDLLSATLILAWIAQVDFIKGDVFTPEAWRHVLKGAGGVVAR